MKTIVRLWNHKALSSASSSDPPPTITKIRPCFWFCNCIALPRMYRWEPLSPVVAKKARERFFVIPLGTPLSLFALITSPLWSQDAFIFISRSLSEGQHKVLFSLYSCLCTALVTKEELSASGGLFLYLVESEDETWIVLEIRKKKWEEKNYWRKAQEINISSFPSTSRYIHKRATTSLSQVEGHQIYFRILRQSSVCSNRSPSSSSIGEEKKTSEDIGNKWII